MTQFFLILFVTDPVSGSVLWDLLHRTDGATVLAAGPQLQVLWVFVFFKCEFE